MAILDPNQQAISQLPQEWKPQFASSAHTLAVLGNEVGRSTPNLSEHEKEQINNAYSESFANPARFADESLVALIQQAGALLAELANMSRSEFLAPAVVAPTARSIIEQSSLIMFLCDAEDSQMRLARTARATKKAIDEEDYFKTLPPVIELRRGLSSVVDTYNSKHRRKPIRVPEKKSELVALQLPWIVGRKLYSELCGYTHHNAFNSFYSWLVAQNNPTGAEITALFFCLCAARAFTDSIAKASAYRREEEIASHMQTIATAVEQLEGLWTDASNLEQKLA